MRNEVCSHASTDIQAERAASDTVLALWPHMHRRKLCHQSWSITMVGQASMCHCVSRYQSPYASQTNLSINQSSVSQSLIHLDDTAFTTGGVEIAGQDDSYDFGSGILSWWIAQLDTHLNRYQPHSAQNRCWILRQCHTRTMEQTLPNGRVRCERASSCGQEPVESNIECCIAIDIRSFDGWAWSIGSGSTQS
jgi:hypothetical protein